MRSLRNRRRTRKRTPEFLSRAAVGGEDFQFSLASALKKGPVVLYFFPKAFTKGCTAEAHAFAEAAVAAFSEVSQQRDL